MTRCMLLTLLQSTLTLFPDTNEHEHERIIDMAPTFPVPTGHFSGLRNIVASFGDDADNMLVAILNYLYSGGAPGSAGERTGMPELDYLDVSGHAAIAAAGGDIWLVGRELLQGQAFDALALWATTSMVTITCLTPGDSGYTIQITDGATAGSEVVTKTDNAFVIQIEVGASTANQIATAINANAADSDGYLRAVSGGTGNTNAIAAATPMVGGTGDFAANNVMVGGLLALPANETGTTTTAKWSATGIICTTQAVGAATDVIAVAVQTNGRWTMQICGVAV